MPAIDAPQQRGANAVRRLVIGLSTCVRVRARVCVPTQGMLSEGCPNATTADCPYNPITVWAPRNAAFAALAASLNTTVDSLLRQACYPDGS